jgi:hypothetical protein
MRRHRRRLVGKMACDFANSYDDWIALPLTPAKAKAVRGVKVTKAWSLPQRP